MRIKFVVYTVSLCRVPVTMCIIILPVRSQVHAYSADQAEHFEIWWSCFVWQNGWSQSCSQCMKLQSLVSICFVLLSIGTVLMSTDLC